MANYTDHCPYCGQMNAIGDARENCGCPAARKWRKIRGALQKQSEESAPMVELEDDVMGVLLDLAHLICTKEIDGVTVRVADGTTVVISGKVSRTARLKVEEKVDE